jgi:hypothetical protein
MKNLGKIFFLLLLIKYSVWAGVNASVDSKNVTLGDMVTFSLNITGEEVKRPNIYNLCGENIISTASATNIGVIDGEYKKSYVLSYKFLPKKSCTIEPVSIEIDSKLEKTEPIEIKVSTQPQTKDANFSLNISVDKKDVYVGEPFELTLMLKQKKSAQAIDSKFIPPSLKGFLVKGESQPTREDHGDYVITKIVYKIATQREGDLKISSAQMRIATRGSSRDIWGGFMPQIKWRSYFSNELELHSKKPPQDLKLVGDFKIQAYTQRDEVNPNEAVNLTIKVTGSGNLEDIKSFKPYISGVNIFDEKIVIDGDTLTQKIAFVGDNNFTIPSFKLKYFNPEKKSVEQISTKEIAIKVNNSSVKKELNIKKDTQEIKVAKTIEKQSENYSLSIILIAFLIGLACGIVMMLFKPSRMFNKEKKKLDIKNHKLLLVKLLPYKDNADVKKVVDILENNLYLDKKIELDKKSLKEIILKYDIS